MKIYPIYLKIHKQTKNEHKKTTNKNNINWITCSWPETSSIWGIYLLMSDHIFSIHGTVVVKYSNTNMLNVDLTVQIDKEYKHLSK